MNGRRDIIAKVRFYTAEEGGRKSPTPSDVFRCPLEFEGEKFDCALLLEGIGSLAPGATATVPIVFLFPEYIKPRLHPGSRFTLWERGTEILTIISLESDDQRTSHTNKCGNQ